MAGSLTGSVDDLPIRVHASGQHIKLKLPFRFGAIRALLRSRQLARLSFPQDLGLRIQVYFGGLRCRTMRV